MNQRKRAFAVAAHPDDIEFVMAGTLILLGEAGYELHYMNIANGCCGSDEHSAANTARIREREAMAAAESIGAEFHPSLVNDLEIFYDHDTLTRLAAVMREVAPEILLVHSPADYMEDHMNACRLALTAAFARGMPNYPTVPERAPIAQAVTVYHAQPHGNRDEFGELVRPSLFVDVAAVMERKTAMLACHQSQKEWLDVSQGFDSYLDTMKELMRELGQLSGRFEYAEGWRRHYHVGFCGPQDDPLAVALGSRLARG
ncbi:MAG TPA: PIG-L family deacetylase [Pirellulales bacterium]|jgi:LmbE family N-acetylglucosaminyl deacetylase|nr:PIG-L family deacetylase [Pirellulales bacterium]